MKILVTFALENEFAPWRAMYDFRPGSWGTADVYSAEIGDAEVGVVLTGAGPRQAAMAASKLFRGAEEAIHFCISAGLAGALRADYEIGRVLAARSVVSETPRRDGESQVVASSGALISFASEYGAIVVNRFYTADHPVASAEEKRDLEVTADAVEMESFEILFEARAAGVPAVAIRAISDAADEDLPLDMSQIFNDEGRVSVPRVLGEVARHPQSLPGLVRLGQNSKRAAESLARFLDGYIQGVARRAKDLEVNARVAAR
jgi:adenosylhomocysteine nucleosidase